MILEKLGMQESGYGGGKPPTNYGAGAAATGWGGGWFLVLYCVALK